TSGSHRGHAVDVFEGRRFWVVHHLAMVATKIAVDVFEGRRLWVIHHLAIDSAGEIFSCVSHRRPVATAATRWMFSKDVGSGLSTIWRWWLRR
ncbi:MAG: hypothetical protein ACK565_07035, partial [Pirellulaceae bacterium]